MEKIIFLQEVNFNQFRLGFDEVLCCCLEQGSLTKADYLQKLRIIGFLFKPSKESRLPKIVKQVIDDYLETDCLNLRDTKTGVRLAGLEVFCHFTMLFG